MNWLKRLIRLIMKLARALIELFTGKTIEKLEAAPAKPEKKKQKPTGRTIYTSYGGPNAPKHQPCPECGSWVKRRSKSETTASYYCTKCHLKNIISLTKKGFRG